MVMFTREEFTDFLTLDTLARKAGVPVDKLPAIVAKELADNALDASGGCRIGYDGTFGQLTVEDDGDGIPGDDEAIAGLFSLRSMTTSKLLRRPTRGALGNGLRVVTGAVLSSGDGGEIIVTTRGRRLLLTPCDDGSVRCQRLDEWDRPGTMIQVDLGDKLQFRDADLAWARDAILLASGTGSTSYQGQSSPYWYDEDSFYRLLQASNGMTARDLVGTLEGCAVKPGNIIGRFRGRRADSLDRAEAMELLELARVKARAVRPERLGKIGQGVPGLTGSYLREMGFFSTTGSRGNLKAELPYVLEVWAEVADRASCRLSVNRTPTTEGIKVYHFPKEAQTQIHGCGIARRFDTGRKPIRYRINIDTPYMPITSDGKSPDLTPLTDVIIDAVEKASGRAKRATQGLSLDTRESRTSFIIDKIPEAAAKASGGGATWFSLRQIFYVIRPLLIARFGKGLDHKVFSAIVAEFERRQGRDVDRMYRDTRGTLYHPHTGEEIALGTLNVKDYERPAWTFNKVLYCEKEGLFPTLKHAKWPERNDCALMTSKGYATRAARDVIDRMGESSEPLQFFCIHDADADGTMIYESLTEATRARPARNVQVHNLGLEPTEGRAMGLEVEPVKAKQLRAKGKGRARAVASYVSDEDREWLQTNRIELNAMTSPQFLAWLDEKFALYAGKLIPPDDVLVEQYRQNVRAGIEQHERDEAIRKAGVAERVERAMRDFTPRIEGRIRADLRGAVEFSLDETPEQQWAAAVATEAADLVADYVDRVVGEELEGGAD